MSLRPLLHKRVNLSITGSDSPAAGYAPAQVTRIILQFVVALTGQGAGLAFGHDWRDDGVMEAIHGFARQAVGPLPVWQEREPEPLLINLVPWPDVPMLDVDERERLRDTLLVMEGGLPTDLRDVAESIQKSGNPDQLLYARARGFTHLRHQLGKISDARVSLGGPEGALGRYPGIIEEAYLAITDGVPLYLSGLLGGVAQQLVDAILQRSMPKNFASRAKAAKLYLHPPFDDPSPLIADDRSFDPEKVWRTFSDLGLEGLSARNGLTVVENKELMQTYSVERAIELITTGVGRVPKRADQSGWRFTSSG